MTDNHPRTTPRHAPRHVYERAADPAEAADRPLEPKYGKPSDPDTSADTGVDPEHRLATPAAAPDPDADADPYAPPLPDEEDTDRASGTRGVNEGTEQ